MDDELKHLQAELTDIKTKQIQIFDHLENMNRRLVSLEERGKSTIDDSKIIEQSTTKTGAPPPVQFKGESTQYMITAGFLYGCLRHKQWK